MRTDNGLVRAALLVLSAGIAACNGGNAAPQPDGPVLGRVLSGNHQTVVAARDAVLPQRVGVQAYQGANGSVALRVLDALLPPKAYAQTAVQGVAGVVVCATAPDPQHVLHPEVPCTQTGADGLAYFTFHNDSVAGTARANVAGTINTRTVITDSVFATVLPGPASPTYLAAQTPIQNFPATVPATEVQDAYGNPVAYRIVSDGRIVVQGDTVGTVAARTIVSGPNAQADYIVNLQDANGVVVGHARYRITQGVLQYFMAGGINTTP